MIATYMYICTKHIVVTVNLQQGQSDDDGDSTYWEPADSINELYKQLSSKKYREIVPTNVK